jgi:hypothetical protein
MAVNCDSKNPLKRDGTSQQQRTLNALLPGYVSVDERSLEDLKQFAIEYAGQLKYFNRNNQHDGDWVGFFDKKISEKHKLNSPHYALFIAFLELFKYAQNDINKITKKHLDFYYKDVLRLEEKPAVPDQVYVIFELAKHVTETELKKGTLLKAGKDSAGINRSYTLDRDITLNKAKVEELKAVFANIHDVHTYLPVYPQNDFRIYTSPVADSQDGIGAEIEDEDGSWRTFGSIQFPDILSGLPEATLADRAQANIGFAFASPNLFSG